VLLIVCAWWLVFFSRTELYKNFTAKSDLEKTLRAISPPAGAKLVKIEAMAAPPPLRTAVVGVYTAHTQVDTVESYYKHEFPRHGFVYRPRAIPGLSDTPLQQFCAPSYIAVLSPGTPDGDVLTYRILLSRRDEPC
jgi:hypothetical protein